jgi:hypothetical protein
MSLNKKLLVISAALGAALLTACATPSPTAQAPAASSTPSASTSAEAAPNSGATEKDTASAMEKRFQDAARSYKVIQKDGKTMYCKREKQIGSTIPTMNCMTEAQLRNQVETMEEYRNRARNSGRCTHGAGCGGGG